MCEQEDIVARLRANAKQAVDSLGHLGVTLESVLEHQAADEIERLRAMLNSICDQCRKYVVGGLPHDHDEHHSASST